MCIHELERKFCFPVFIYLVSGIIFSSCSGSQIVRYAVIAGLRQCENGHTNSINSHSDVTLHSAFHLRKGLIHVTRDATKIVVSTKNNQEKNTQ